ncbi:DUF6314 family protein [Salinimonas lutimaris]|uniref:DUF6314 family protein n=1 Tax=Salinimonas lutimaris TaxID=914153 RepID=UPI001586EDB7|nr:DUF6314 family protein [Salinimonas lutimaris]
MNFSKNSSQTNDYQGDAHADSSFLRQFAGQWLLQRQIEQQNGQMFCFTGKAVFSWQDEELLYRESGQVTTPEGASFQAQRSYIWTSADTQHIDVLFEDRRFFHRFSVASPHAEHLCGDDHYIVKYDLNQWPRWEAYWHVSGPRKDYAMTSRYQRCELNR